MLAVTAAGYRLRCWLAGAVASAALLLVAPAIADEAKALLDNMADAAREQSFRGDFVYERPGSFSTHRIWRQIGDPVVERLLRTDGVGHEWVRRGGHLECTSAQAGALTWRDSGVLADESSTLHQWYSLQVLGVSRVANRAVTVVAVNPRDPFRYAYELYLDVDSGLLLQSLLLNDKGILLERFQFTNLELGPVEQDQLSAASACLAVNEWQQWDFKKDDRWLPAWLPPGFIPVRSESQQLAGDDGQLFAQVFTDGLARFTVFIEPVAESRVASDLHAQLGPTVAVSRKLTLVDGTYLVTVVGEVPPLAAERVAASLAPDFDQIR